MKTNSYTLSIATMLSTGLCAGLHPAAVSAAEISQEIEISGGVTVTGQTASDSHVEDEAQGSADLVGAIPLGPGTVNFYIEASTTTGDNGVAALLGEANADAGSAVNEDDKGRVQISELFYGLSLGFATLDVGLLDPTANLDTNAVANDENSQFLAGPLVNNPTIGFPDYTLGLRLGAEPEQAGFGYNLFVGSSHGLGDNPSREYGELFELDATGKGLFVAAEGVWKTDSLVGRAGAWINSADFARLDSSDTEHNYGLYASVDGPMGAGTWGVRGGVANPEVSEAAWSLGAAAEYPVLDMAKAGLGLVHTADSQDLPAGFDDNLTAEIYMRFDLDAHLQLTPLVQYIQNSNFDSSAEVIDQEQWLAGLRIHVPF